MQMDDTIVARASAPGRSARALIRISGPGARDLWRELNATRVGGENSSDFERGLWRGRLNLGQGRALAVDLLTFAGPASLTGEDVVELALPGNPVLVERIVDLLTQRDGWRSAGPGEFAARAYFRGKLSLDEAEGIAQTIAAESAQDLTAAEELLRGRTGNQYRAWADAIATLLALVEAGVDFTDQEDVVPISAEDLASRLRELAAEIDEFTGSAAGGELRVDVPRVVLAGPPNAGKSTLFNALLGRERAVASPMAGTTRDVLSEPLELGDVWPGAGEVVLVDLAGLHDAAALPTNTIDAQADARAREEISRADLVLHCNASGSFDGLSGVDESRVLRVRTKGDVPSREGEAGDVSVCAMDGWHVRELLRTIAERSFGGGVRASLMPRHRIALGNARRAIDDAREATGEVLEAELVAVPLREALDALGELTGDISPDDIIGRIFSTFCVGK